LNTLKVEKFFSIMRSLYAMPSALQWLNGRASAVYEEYKRRLGEEGLLGWDLYNHERYGRGHYAGVASSSIASSAAPIYKRLKPQPSRSTSDQAIEERQRKLGLLQAERAEQKPLTAKRVTDRKRAEVGTKPLFLSQRPREGSQPARRPSILSSLQSRAAATSKARAGRQKAEREIEQEVVLSAGDLVVVKAMKGAGELFWLGQLKQSVLRELTYAR
jgi:hypothetical protein